ncbi:hypothetical protein [Colwellia sp. UCD-KL20]|uniref:hypothetical protein n=1 Tax=Colwellia sp. UCD-KL20 TaxID=1917165 RepID=UPI0009709BBE|nr:hypothetical protein [Colwellia sp. UCD-KL20]
MSQREKYEINKKLYRTQADLDYMLYVFGDDLAKRESYKDLDGIEAVQFYIVHKFHWLPSQVKAMTHEELRFVLTEEMHGWTAPKDAVFGRD